MKKGLTFKKVTECGGVRGIEMESYHHLLLFADFLGKPFPFSELQLFCKMEVVIGVVVILQVSFEQYSVNFT